jgi:hypothetical protein
MLIQSGRISSLLFCGTGALSRRMFGFLEIGQINF